MRGVFRHTVLYPEAKRLPGHVLYLKSHLTVPRVVLTC